MSKFSKIPKLSKKERQKLLIALCEALTSIRKKEEAAQFLADLLSPQELEMLAKRLEIAKLLIAGDTYETIRAKLKVSHNTIARVNAWLTLSGGGFRLVIERTRKRGRKIYDHTFEEKYDPQSWYNIKRRYSLHFLPELLIEEIIKRSNEAERKRLDSILSSIEGKPEVFKNVDARFKDQFVRIKKLLPASK
jgi:TrpR-related protein YerC/YecD